MVSKTMKLSATLKEIQPVHMQPKLFIELVASGQSNIPVFCSSVSVTSFCFWVHWEIKWSAQRFLIKDGCHCSDRGAALASRHDAQTASLSAQSLHSRRLKICKWVRKILPTSSRGQNDSHWSAEESKVTREAPPPSLGLDLDLTRSVGASEAVVV